MSKTIKQGARNQEYTHSWERRDLQSYKIKDESNIFSLVNSAPE